MSRRRSILFLNVNSAPDPNSHPGLWEHRLKQRRPLSRNPFEPEDSPNTTYEITPIESAGQRPKFDSIQSSENSKEDVRRENKNHDEEWGDQAPEWLNLFYDLAWTATFASLTSNNKFKAPWDSVSYIVFFTVAWWMWTSQVFYSVDFYTDDWFHLLIVFLQLIIFGALAATTRGFDVSTYILHSPGSSTFESSDLETMTPDRYSADRLTGVSLEVIAIVFAISRLLLLVQHLRVVVYAKVTTRSKRYPLRLLIVPAALAISTALFFAAYVISHRHGEEPGAARNKFILWGMGILIEVVAHVVRFQWEINDGIRLKSHGSITGRLSGITTIILGEGINAIAGTFYAIEKAPGFSGPTGAGIICCAIIVFFLAYLYFEGAAPLKSVRRRAAWVMVHLPWLLSVILLLEGVKNQLLLSSFMNTTIYMLGKASDLVSVDAMYDEALFNQTLRLFLLQGGMDISDQWQKLGDLAEEAMTLYNVTEFDDDMATEVINVWYRRLQMSTTMHTYINFMDNDTISDETQQTIYQYGANYTFTAQDVEFPSIFFDTLWQLIKASIDNGRYISGLCGLTFIGLATLNLIQSWPRDRFHWASIISRFTMGVVMMLLLLLNVGDHQTYFDDPRARLFDWIDANWVLPTLALAYGVQFIIDTVLVYVAVYVSRKSHPLVVEPNKLE